MFIVDEYSNWMMGLRTRLCCHFTSTKPSSLRRHNLNQELIGPYSYDMGVTR